MGRAQYGKQKFPTMPSRGTSELYKHSHVLQVTTGSEGTDGPKPTNEYIHRRRATVNHQVIKQLLIKQVSIPQKGRSCKGTQVGSTALRLLYSHALQKHLPWVTVRNGSLPEGSSVQTIAQSFSLKFYLLCPQVLLLGLMIIEVLSNLSQFYDCNFKMLHSKNHTPG